MTKITDQQILKAVLLMRRHNELDGGRNYQTKDEQLAEQREWAKNPRYAEGFDEWVDSLREDLRKTPEQRAAEHEKEFAEFLEREAEWDRQQQREMEYERYDRDEWDDLWADRARSVGAVYF